MGMQKKLCPVCGSETFKVRVRRDLSYVLCKCSNWECNYEMIFTNTERMNLSMLEALVRKLRQEELKNEN